MRALGPRLVAGLIAAGLVLSGCGGAPEPGPPPKPSKSSSPSPSATPTPPVLPEVARAKTKAGAEGAVRYFLSAMEYAGDTGDTKTFEGTYTSECTRCAAITEGIRSTYANGGSIVGGGWHPTRLKFYDIENDTAYIDAIVDYEAQVWVKDSNGTKTTSPARQNVLKAFQLLWRQGRWRVGALDPQA